MNNYSDKEFKEIYSEVVENVKTLTSKWDPSVSDESDPGVVILKAFALFLDKVNYKINYRNAQNSVKSVTDPIEAKKLFYELGYQMKRKRSATGNLLVRYIGESNSISLPIFTQFSNQTGSQNYTSIRTTYFINSLSSSLIKVQEGVPSRYAYEGADLFSIDNLTTNLRLPLLEVGDISDNGVVICSKQYVDSSGKATTSDWLDVGDSIFTAVETDNIFSIGHNSEGEPYIQFYEESLPGLKDGIGIWVISSSGSAGNVPKNTINRMVSEIEGASIEDFVISHTDFSNGSDEESIKSATNNYYDSFGINSSLISERDYSISIPKILRTDLSKLASKALVTGVDGYHNSVEIVSKVNNGKDRVILIKLFETFLSHIFVNTLKSTKNYYESFEKLVDAETENLIKKSFYKDSVVSNDLVLTGAAKDSNSNFYDEYVFDLASLSGTLVVNSEDEMDTIRNNVVLAIYKAFNSDSLTAGEMIKEEVIAEVVEKSINGAILASFRYDDHNLVKNISAGLLTEDQVIKGLSKDVQPKGKKLSDDEKSDLLARSVLRGDTSLFSENDLQIPPGSSSLTQYPSDNKKIEEITGSFDIVTDSYRSYTLRENEFIQFYTKARSKNKSFGFGFSYILQADQVKLKEDLALLNGKSYLVAGSVITKDSEIFFGTDEGGNIVNSDDPLYKATVAKGEDGIVKDTSGKQIGVVRKVSYNYTVEKEVTLEGPGNILKIGTVIYDGSTIYPKSDHPNLSKEHLTAEKKVYGCILNNDIEHNLENLGVKLRVQTGDDSSTIVEYPNSEVKFIRISGFSGGLTSSGEKNNQIVPNKYILAQEQIDILTDQKTVLLAKNYLYILVLNNDKELKLYNNKPYLLEEGEHLIYSDKTLVDFVDFGSGTLIHNPNDLPVTLQALNTYEVDITEKLVPLDSEIQIFNTQIYSYQEGTKLTVKEDTTLTIYEGTTATTTKGFTPTRSWGSINGEGVIVNDGVYGKDYYCRAGLTISTLENKVFRLLKGQKLLLKFVKESGETRVESEGEISTSIGEVEYDQIFISSSLPIQISLSEKGLINSDNLKLVSYNYSVNSEDFNVTANYSDNSYGLKAEVKVDGDSTLSLPITVRSYLLEISINISESNSDENPENNPEISFSLTNYTGGSFVKILNTTETTISGSGTYQVYINNKTDPNSVQNLTITAKGLTSGNKIEFTNFIDLSGFNTKFGDLGSKVYEKTNELIGNGKIPFDFFYKPISPINEPLEVLSFYNPKHIMNRNILTVIDLKYLWDHLDIINRSRK